MAIAGAERVRAYASAGAGVTPTRVVRACARDAIDVACCSILVLDKQQLSRSSAVIAVAQGGALRVLARHLARLQLPCALRSAWVGIACRVRSRRAATSRLCASSRRAS